MAENCITDEQGYRGAKAQSAIHLNGPTAPGMAWDVMEKGYYNCPIWIGWHRTECDLTERMPHQPVCAPNRGTIFSGLYPHNHGVLENTWDIDPEIPLFPTSLKAAGYRCAYFGKWHLGDPSRDAWEDQCPHIPATAGDKGIITPSARKKCIKRTCSHKTLLILFRKEDATSILCLCILLSSPSALFCPRKIRSTLSKTLPQ